MTRSDILDRIVAQKQREIVDSNDRALRDDWKNQCRDLPEPPDFRAALSDRSRIRVIAEIKKASPSAGVIRPDFDPVAVAVSYDQHGADCISVLTDRKYFAGDLTHLAAVSQAVARPTLRKDFVIDAVQILEARLAGAGGVLLIAECLTAQQLADFVGLVRELKMAPLVELHDPENLPGVLASGADLIGVNNRDLRTFHTSLDMTVNLLPQIPADKLVVSESGIHSVADVLKAQAAGARAILVGEAFMRTPDPGVTLARFLGQLESHQMM